MELSDLLCKKGEIITNLEVLQEQLKMINQQIYEIKSNEMKQSAKKDISKKSNKE